MASSPAASSAAETPALALFVDGRPIGRVGAPAQIAPRAWILGVVAVQLRWVNGALAAQLRVHTTGGAAAEVTPLRPGSLVQVALTGGIAPGVPSLAVPAAARLPELTTPPLGDARARLALFVGDALRDQVAASPPPDDGSPRAFGHVFCRWLRDGGFEAGYDLTDFVALPPGQMYPRRVSEPLVIGKIVSFVVVA